MRQNREYQPFCCGSLSFSASEAETTPGQVRSFEPMPGKVMQQGPAEVQKTEIRWKTGTNLEHASAALTIRPIPGKAEI